MDVSLKTRLIAIRYKILLIGVLLSIGIFVAIAKSGFLQLKRGKELQNLSEKQAAQIGTATGRRGRIFDRDNKLLAQSVSMESVYAEPNRVENPTAIARALAPLLHQPIATLKSKLSEKKAFLWLARRVKPSLSNQIRKHSLPGVGLIQEDKRFYPLHESMGQILGTVSVDGDGFGGVEQTYDYYLKPATHKSMVFHDAKGSKINIHPSPAFLELGGNDLYLTLDSNVQYLTEKALEKSLRATGAKAAWAIVMEPHTGDILAIANVPFTNPNNPKQGNLENRRNRALAESFEPGSVFKLVPFVAALEENTVTADTRINTETGSMKVQDFTIKDLTKRDFMTGKEVLQYSSNIGIYKIASQVGKEKIYQMIENFGFGSSPGLRLIEETKGKITPPSTWRTSRFANISFGYGIMVSTLQLLNMASAIANGGILIEPRLVKYIKQRDGTMVFEEHSGSQKRIMRKETAKQITDIMVAVTESGTGKKARIQGVQVAGKSGTAEKVEEGTGKYNKRKNRSSFIGFAPANQPELAAVVIIDEPQGIALGGAVAGPVFHEIMAEALAYWRAAPTKAQNSF